MGIIRPVISTRQRSSMVLRGLVGSVVCFALLTSACNDSQKPQESPQPAPQVTAVAPPAPPPVALQFTDVTAAAGVVFRHEAGATGKKWYPETMGAGGGFFDYDGDGWLDMLLVNGRQWPGEGAPLTGPLRRRSRGGAPGARAHHASLPQPG